MEVSEHGPDEEDVRDTPKKGEKQKRIKSTSRSTAKSRESEDDSLEYYTSVKYRDKISKFENRLFQAHKSYIEILKQKQIIPLQTYSLLKCTQVN